MSGAAYLALDLGGTQTRAAVVDEAGSVLMRLSSQTPVEGGGDAIVSACIASLRAIRDRWEADGGHPPVVAAGLSAPGPVDPYRGWILDPPNLGATFRDIPFAERVSGALGLPVALDRDTQVAALAEGAFGAARGARDFVYLTVSTGIGGAVVSNGRLLRGPDGTAGELGHLTVDVNGPTCGCGAVGHLEAIASGLAIARAGIAAVSAGGPLADRLRERGDGRLTARDVAELALAGDTTAGRIMDEARRAFAAAAVTITDVFNPELIVVGGSLAMGEADRLLDPARRAVGEHAFAVPGRRVRIVPSALGDDVGLAGAAALIAERLASGALLRYD